MTPFQIFFFFFRISAVTFGGGIAILGMVRLGLSGRGILSDEEIADVANLAVAMPGPIAVSCSCLIGRRLAGFRGAVCGVMGAVLPPFLTILLLSSVLLDHFDDPMLKKFFAGVLAAVTAMIAAMVWRDVRATLSARLLNLVPYAAVIAAISILKIHPLLALVAGFAVQNVTVRCERMLKAGGGEK